MAEDHTPAQQTQRGWLNPEVLELHGLFHCYGNDGQTWTRDTQRGNKGTGTQRTWGGYLWTQRRSLGGWRGLMKPLRNGAEEQESDIRMTISKWIVLQKQRSGCGPEEITQVEITLQSLYRHPWSTDFWSDNLWSCWSTFSAVRGKVFTCLCLCLYGEKVGLCELFMMLNSLNLKRSC